MVPEWISLLLHRIVGSTPSLPRMTTGDNEDNHTMIQFFEWESLPPPGISWWKHFENEIPLLASLGCTQVWLPPPNKAMVPEGRGYDAYDLVSSMERSSIVSLRSCLSHNKWDLGEFKQKGTTATRWGTKEEFLQCISTAKSHGIGILLDAVLNHKLGADRTERFQAVEVHPDNRLLDLGPPKEIEGWTAFDFPGRGDKYSTMKWNQSHFTGVDWDQAAKRTAIYKIVGGGHKGWSNKVDSELGNYDYLLGIDIDLRHPEVKKDYLDWAAWVLKETGCAGLRLDACKHMDRDFLRDFIKVARDQPGFERAFVVSEFWIDSVKKIERYMAILNAPVSMFDVPLHYNFHRASTQGSEYDLRRILKGSLVDRRPLDAVTFVDNHDTAIGCSLESWVGREFKLQAYAVILLRPDGHPCVYHADLYDEVLASKVQTLMKARAKWAYGKTTDYFSDGDRNCIGWVRHGDGDSSIKPSRHPEGCVVLCSNADATKHSTPFQKDMVVGVRYSTRAWKNIMGDEVDTAARVTISSEGRGVFTCPPNGVAVWVPE
ncbi:hypothetical protein FRB94_014148 [Tulasnella sp. JGI-2019a]|nr:hypothetical protein FRB94_014148 [Tulasnella sp. JGI-2019a]